MINNNVFMLLWLLLFPQKLTFSHCLNHDDHKTGIFKSLAKHVCGKDNLVSQKSLCQALVTHNTTQLNDALNFDFLNSKPNKRTF